MSAPTLVFSDPAREFIAGLLGEREVTQRAQIVAAEIAGLFPDSAVVVYIVDQEGRCAAKGHSGDIKRPRRPFHPQGTTLERAIHSRAPIIFSGKALPRENYQHLDLRREVQSLTYIPLHLDEVPVGAIEIISYGRMIEPAHLDIVRPMVELASLALAVSIAYESERNSQLNTIARLTQLYDLERTFNSTLYMEQLLPLITAKVRDALEVEVVNLWMVEGDDLLLMSQAGEDPTTTVGGSEAPGSTIAKEVSDTGKSVLVRTPEDPRLQSRNGDRTPAPLRTVLAVPIVSQNFQVGVLEVANKLNGQAMNENDAFYLATISVTAGSALHNASLLEAEKKIEILETLVTVSQEITSTLNLERVLQVVVNGPQKILTYDRAAIALQQFGSLQIRAISGKTDIVQQDPAVKQLRDVITFAAVADGDVYVTQRANEVEADREESRQKFKDHFATTGFRGWFSMRLEDDQGLLGVLSFESKNPDFLSAAQMEFIKVVSSQATVAIRNASLYKEVPLIGMLEPLLQKKQQFLRGKSSRSLAAGAAAALAIVLTIIPLPLRVTGDAAVAPLLTSHMQALVPGVVSKIYVREGERVGKGTVLADLDDTEYRAQLAGAQAKYSTALSAMNTALATNNGGEAGTRRVEAEYWASEVARGRERLERTHLKAPFDGIVVGPDLEVSTGKHLAAGEALCDVVNTERARVDVEVDEDDLPLLKGGEATAVKVESYPLRTFAGTVTLLSPSTVANDDRRTFMARVDVANGEQLLRGGMRGRAKIKVGWRPSGYVLFRGMGTWLWAKLWSAFGG